MMTDAIARITTNPLISIHASFADREIFPIDTRYFANARTIRGLIGDIINERKQQKNSEASDIISLLL